MINQYIKFIIFDLIKSYVKMKKYIYLFFISTFIIGCSEKKEVLEIPLTSNSQEAVALFQNEVFRPKSAYRLFSQEMGKVLSQILEKDPNFHLFWK